MRIRRPRPLWLLGVLVVLELGELSAADQFRSDTTFELGPANRRLLGGATFLESTGPTHLPSWFQFERFKSAFGKRYADPLQELAAHHAYVATCVRVLKARVLYRILASTEDAQVDESADSQLSPRPPPSRQPPPERPLLTGRSSLRNTTHTPKQLPVADNSEAPPGRLHLSVQLEPDLAQETPVERALRLVRTELERVESRNQLQAYLRALQEVDGGSSPMLVGPSNSRVES